MDLERKITLRDGGQAKYVQSQSPIPLYDYRIRYGIRLKNRCSPLPPVLSITGSVLLYKTGIAISAQVQAEKIMSQVK